MTSPYAEFPSKLSTISPDVVVPTSTLDERAPGVLCNTRGFGGFAICGWDKFPIRDDSRFHKKSINGEEQP